MSCATNSTPFPYHSFNRYLRRRYGTQVRKIALDAGFGCPHREAGTAVREKRQGPGCIYCNNESFSPYAGLKPPPVQEQLAMGISQASKRTHTRRFIAYFQAYTNTYGPVSLLKNRYDMIRRFPEVVGLTVGTRPDCVSEETLDLLESYSNDYEVWVEYGLQSAHNTTLEEIHRGHTVEDFLEAIRLTASRKILICVHIILGLPGEGRHEMLETAKLLAGLPIQGIKIHHCHVVKGTLLAERFLKGAYRPLELSQYIQVVADILERLPWPITIQRLLADASGDFLLAPRWGQAKTRIIEAIQQELYQRRSRQGKKA